MWVTGLGAVCRGCNVHTSIQKKMEYRGELERGSG